jgi:hypothetical protein
VGGESGFFGIPRSPENPEILRVDDPEVVRDCAFRSIVITDSVSS